MSLLDDLLAADPITLILSLLLTTFIFLIPIIITGLPELFFRHYERKKNRLRLTRAIYSRFYLGFVIFWFLYYVIPAILNFIVPNERAFEQVQIYHYPPDSRYIGPKIFSTIWEPDLYTFTKYIGQMIANAIILYLQYPILILPPVFIAGAFLALIILLLQVYQRTKDQNIANLSIKIEENNKNDEQASKEYDENDPNAPLVDVDNIRAAQARTRQLITLGDNLDQISYELPREKTLDEIIERVRTSNFRNEKELFQIIMAILPISLFLLMSLLKILGQEENPTLLQGTPMGWFLEIFFVYLATIVFSVYLLKACNFSLRGDPGISSRLYQTMYQSLVTVGAFMSIIASILFLVEFPEQIFVVIFFIIYFIMVTLFFVLFLDIFEPISRYLLYQMLNTIKKSRTISTAIPSERLLVRALSPMKWFSLLKSTLGGLARGVNQKANLRTIKMISITIIVLLIISLAEYSGIVFFDFIYADFLLRPHAVTFYYTMTLYLKLTILVLLAIFFRRYNWNVRRNAISIFVVGFLYSLFLGFFIYHPFKQFFQKSKIPVFRLPMYHPNSAPSDYFVPVLFPTFITISNFLFTASQQNFWITSILKFGMFGGLFIIIPETFFVESGFSGTGQEVLALLSAPYIFFRELTVLLFFGLFVHLLQVKHHIKTIHHPEKTNILTKTVLSQRWVLSSVEDLEQQPNSYRFLLTDSGKSLEWKAIIASLSVIISQMEKSNATEISLKDLYHHVNNFLTIDLKEDSELTHPVFWKAIAIIASTKPIAKLFTLHDEKDNPIDEVTEILLGNAQKDLTSEEAHQPLDLKIIFQDIPNNQKILSELRTFTEINKFLIPHPEQTPSVKEISDILNKDIDIIQNEINDLYQIIPGFKRYMVFLGEEFGYSYEEVSLDSLHVMMIDGRSIFTFLFREESVVEPALVAGLFAAITSFAQEAVQSKELLRSIDHGDVFLTIEYGQNILAAVFSDKASSEIRRKLQQFVKEFEQRHGSELRDWLGDQSLFYKDVELVRKIFEIDESVGKLVT